MEEVQKPSILIVDDSPEIVEILDRILNKEYNVKVALNGEKALSKVFSQEPPDLILLDIMMQEMDGYEVCMCLKKHETIRKIPVIFLSAMDEVKDESKGFEVGAVDYITKPFSPVIVKARVKTHIELSIARRELEKQNEQLQASLQLREDMANMIVHDMRNPIGAILGYSDLLFLKQGIQPQYLKYLEKIQSQANQINDFLNDMLIMAKTEKSRLILDRMPADLNTILRSLENIHSVIADSRGIRLVIENPQDSPLLLLDIKLFQRVLDNLIANALKFSPIGSKVTVHVEYPATENSKARIQVIDEGIGIASENKERIFNRFEIVKLKNKDVPQTGFGLAFCKAVVEAHGGNIFVTDNVPTGAIFNIEI